MNALWTVLVVTLLAGMWRGLALVSCFSPPLLTFTPGTIQALEPFPLEKDGDPGLRLLGHSLTLSSCFNSRSLNFPHP
jgi:hypothetical protein